MMIAARYGLTDMVEQLLYKGANTASMDNNGRTALMHAAEKGHPETIAMLIKGGSDIEARDKHGATALLIAADKGNADFNRCTARCGR